MKQVSEAIKAYDKAIEINPQNSVAWSNKGAVLANLGRFDESVTAHIEGIEINPQL